MQKFPPEAEVKSAPTSSQQAIKRLNYLEGHLKGVRKMIEEGRYCIDIVNQIRAVQSALTQVNLLILERHFNRCLAGAIGGGDLKERKKKLDEILSLFQQINQAKF